MSLKNAHWIYTSALPLNEGGKGQRAVWVQTTSSKSWTLPLSLGLPLSNWGMIEYHQPRILVRIGWPRGNVHQITTFQVRGYASKGLGPLSRPCVPLV